MSLTRPPAPSIFAPAPRDRIRRPTTSPWSPACRHHPAAIPYSIVSLTRSPVATAPGRLSATRTRFSPVGRAAGSLVDVLARQRAQRQEHTRRPDAVRHGDYAKKIPAATLMSDPRASRHPTEIANVCGARLAVSSEVAEGEHWTKAGSRNSPATKSCPPASCARTFSSSGAPTSTSSTATTTHAAHRRPRYGRAPTPGPVQRNFHRRGRQPRPRHASKLRVEAAAILQWLIEGHEKWRQDGTLHRCATVETATADYFSAQSTLDMWIAERCIAIDDDGRSGRGWPRPATCTVTTPNGRRPRRAPHGGNTLGEQMTSRFRKSRPTECVTSESY